MYVSMFESVYKEEGLKEGLKRGRKEKAHEIAKNFLADGISPEVVARNTGLPLQTIRALAP